MKFAENVLSLRFNVTDGGILYYCNDQNNC